MVSALDLKPSTWHSRDVRSHTVSGHVLHDDVIVLFDVLDCLLCLAFWATDLRRIVPNVFIYCWWLPISSPSPNDHMTPYHIVDAICFARTQGCCWQSKLWTCKHLTSFQRGHLRLFVLRLQHWHNVGICCFFKLSFPASDLARARGISIVWGMRVGVVRSLLSTVCV